MHTDTTLEMNLPITGNSLITRDLDIWNESVSEIFCPMSCNSTPSEFNGHINLGRLDKIRLTSIGGSSLDVSRTRRHIAYAVDNYYLIKFQMEGKSRIQHCGREALLRPGDFAVCSSSDPYELSFSEPYSQVVLSIPQSQLDDLAPDVGNVLGHAMKSEDPVNGMLSQFVLSIAQRYEQLPTNLLRRMEANVLDLLLTTLEAHHSPALKKTETTQQDHILRIKRFISLHLQDIRLGPESIAKAEGIGTRYLHMLFKKEGLSVSRYIQLKRLEASARLLSDPATAKVSTMDIAFQVGFNDVSHFYRCFKSKFGVTPKQYREGGRQLI